MSCRFTDKQSSVSISESIHQVNFPQNITSNTWQGTRPRQMRVMRHIWMYKWSILEH